MRNQLPIWPRNFCLEIINRKILRYEQHHICLPGLPPFTFLFFMCECVYVRCTWPFFMYQYPRYLSSLPWLFQPACTLSCYNLYIVINYNKLLLMVLYKRTLIKRVETIQMQCSKRKLLFSWRTKNMEIPTEGNRNNSNETPTRRYLSYSSILYHKFPKAIFQIHCRDFQGLTARKRKQPRAIKALESTKFF